jgi:hypothetical protein
LTESFDVNKIRILNNGTDNVIVTKPGSSIIGGTQTVATGSGTALPSNPCFSVTVRSLSGNTPIYVAGANTLANSGVGTILYATDSATFNVNNTNQVSVYATNSGNQFVWIGTVP